MDFINGFSRDQLIMMDFEANVARDSWARVVDWFVDALPLHKLGFKDVLNSEGRPPYVLDQLICSNYLCTGTRKSFGRATNLKKRVG